MNMKKAPNAIVHLLMVSTLLLFLSMSSLAEAPNATKSGQALAAGAEGPTDDLGSYLDKISSLNKVVSPSNASASPAADADYGMAKSSNVLASLTSIPGFSTYEGFTDYGIKIGYPENWSSEEAEVRGMNAVLFFPPDNDTENMTPGQFRDNISVAYQSLPMPITLDEFAEIFTSETEQQSPDVIVISENDTTLGTVPAKEVTYSLMQAQTNLRMRQVYAVKGSRAYVITYTAEAGRFNDLEGVFRKMLRSVELI